MLQLKWIYIIAIFFTVQHANAATDKDYEATLNTLLTALKSNKPSSLFDIGMNHKNTTRYLEKIKKLGFIGEV